MKNPRSLTADVEREHDSDAPFEIATVQTKYTGLPFVAWISVKGGAQHDVRVKVSPGPKALPSEMASVAIRPSVRVVEGRMSASDLALLTESLDLNRDVLVRYWSGEIEYTDEAIAAIRPIR